MIEGMIEGHDACETARRKARYGLRSWVRWQDAAGRWYAAPLSRDAMKAALLAVGTKRSGIVVHHRGDNHGQLCNWNMGVRIHRQLSRGHGWVYGGAA
jgi:hypothetical protein